MPNYGLVQARYGAESERPNLWTGLQALWTPPVTPTGLTWRDQSMHRRDGTLTNMDPATDWVMSPYGWALRFDGSSGVVNTNISLPGGPFSYVWSVLVHDRVANDYFTTTNHPREVCLLSGYVNNNFSLIAWQAANSNILIPDTTDFHHYAYTYDGATFACYRDGANVGGASTGTGPAAYDLWRFGGETATGQVMNATLRSLSIYDRGLIPFEIADLHADPLAMLRRRRAVFAAPFVPYPYPRHELTGGLAV